MTKSILADLAKFGDSFFFLKTCLLQRYAVAGDLNYLKKFPGCQNDKVHSC